MKRNLTVEVASAILARASESDHAAFKTRYSDRPKFTRTQDHFYAVVDIIRASNTVELHFDSSRPVSEWYYVTEKS